MQKIMRSVLNKKTCCSQNAMKTAKASTSVSVLKKTMLPPVMANMESTEGGERTEGRRSKTRKDDRTKAEQQGHEKKKTGEKRGGEKKKEK